MVLVSNEFGNRWAIIYKFEAVSFSPQNDAHSYNVIALVNAYINNGNINIYIFTDLLMIIPYSKG